jgi:hypothetical protein
VGLQLPSLDCKISINAEIGWELLYSWLICRGFELSLGEAFTHLFKPVSSPFKPLQFEIDLTTDSTTNFSYIELDWNHSFIALDRFLCHPFRDVEASAALMYVNSFFDCEFITSCSFSEATKVSSEAVP